MYFNCFLIVGHCSFYLRIKITAMDIFMINTNLCAPLVMICTPINTLKYRRCIGSLFGICLILGRCCKPKVIATVIKPISVDVVYMFSVRRIHDQSMHEKCCVLTACVNICISIRCIPQLPGVCIPPIRGNEQEILIIYYRFLVLVQLNFYHLANNAKFCYICTKAPELRSGNQGALCSWSQVDRRLRRRPGPQGLKSLSILPVIACLLLKNLIRGNKQ